MQCLILIKPIVKITVFENVQEKSKILLLTQIMST